MMAKSLSWICIGVTCVIVVSCNAPSKAWNGEWKLNVSKSNMPGPDLSITVSPTGEFQTDNGTYRDKFRCDGKEYSMGAGHQTSCVQSGSLAMDMSLFTNGAKTQAAHFELSPDQGTMIIEATRVQPDGTARSQKTVYLRTSGSTGFSGGWRNPKHLESRPQLMVLTLNEHYLRVAFPEADQYTDVSLDGKDSVVHTARQTPGPTLAMHPNGPAEFLTTVKSGDRILRQGSLLLSKDGRTITETFWRPEMPNNRAVLTYERQ